MSDDTLGDDLEANIVSMLASIQTDEDVTKVLDAGVSESCFIGAAHYWAAFQYIAGRIRAGKNINRPWVKRKWDIHLPLEADDPKLYADEVVLCTAVTQADEILADMKEEMDNAKAAPKKAAKGFYESLSKARNLLRSVASPVSSKASPVANGRTMRYDQKGSLIMPPPQKWIVRGLVPDEWPTFFYGRGGSAKSYLAVYLALAVATGHRFLGVPSAKGKVLYLDWEMGEETFRARINRVASSLGIDLENGIPNLAYKRLYKPLKEHLDDIIDECDGEGYSMVIIDSFGFSMTGMDTNTQPDVTAQMARIAQIPAAAVIIDHISKHGKGEEGPFGSVYKHAAARWMWWLRAASKEVSPNGKVEPGIFVRLWNAKHNIAAQQNDIYLQIVWDDEFDSDTVSIERVSKDKVPASLTEDIKEGMSGESGLTPNQDEFLEGLADIYAETRQPATKEAMKNYIGVKDMKTITGIAKSLEELGMVRPVVVHTKTVGKPLRGYLLVNQIANLDTKKEEAEL